MSSSSSSEFVAFSTLDTPAPTPFMHATNLHKRRSIMNRHRQRRSSMARNLRTYATGTSSLILPSPSSPTTTTPRRSTRLFRSQTRLADTRTQPYPRSFQSTNNNLNHFTFRYTRDPLSQSSSSSDDDDMSSEDSATVPLTVKERQAAINTKHPFGFRLWKPALYKKQRGIEQVAEQELFSGLTPKHQLATSSLPITPGPASTVTSPSSIVPAPMSPGVPSVQALQHYAKDDDLRSRLFSRRDPGSSQSILPSASASILPQSSTSSIVFPNSTSWAQCWQACRRALIPSNVAWSLLFGIPLSIFTFGSALVVLCVSFGTMYSTFVSLSRIASYWIWPFNRHFVSVTRLPTRPNNVYSLALKRLILTVILGPVYLLVSAACWMIVVYVPMAKATRRVGLAIWNDPLILVVDGVLSADPNFYLAVVDIRHLPDPLLIVPDASGESEPLLADDVEPQQMAVPATSVHGQIVLCIARAGGLRFFKYTWHGTNVVFVNLIPFILWVLAEGYAMSASPKQPLRLFTLCLLATIPLSYFIGMAVASISAQSTPAIGAVLNATFGSIIEITLYSLALYNGKHALVEGAVTGTLLGVLLLLPGISMAAGGLRFKQLSFNSKSAGVSTTMLIMALIGGFTPTLFNQIFGRFDVRCASCTGSVCSDCTQKPQPDASDYVYNHAVVPLSHICATVLPLIYVIGLIFSLKTHRKHIYHANEATRHLPHTPAQVAIPTHRATDLSVHGPAMFLTTPNTTVTNLQSPDKHHGRTLSSVSIAGGGTLRQGSRSVVRSRSVSRHPTTDTAPTTPAATGGGHEAPEWSRTTSLVVLISCTISFALIAELLVGTLEGVLVTYPFVPEKFLGVTLVALVPSMTEFVNAAAFALQGNISLSLEIGSAYAVQVALLQIPSLVWYGIISEWAGLRAHKPRILALVFPIWDMTCVFLAVFLLSYVYMEGQSNYFKGAILASSYFVLMAGFYFASILPDLGPGTSASLVMV